MVGLLALAGGAAIWIRAFQNLRASGGVAISPEVVSSTLTLVSLGMLIALSGVGLCIYSVAVRRRSLRGHGIGSSAYSNEASLRSRSVSSSTGELLESIENSNSTRRGSKPVFAALVQSLVLVALYAGLVEEYVANASMQHWVHANFALGGYVLNYDGVLIVAGLLSVLVFQFLHKNRFSK